MKKYYFIYACGLLLSLSAYSQKPITITCQQLEKELIPYTIQMVQDSSLAKRLSYNALFTKKLVEILKSPFSFNFSFPNLHNISHIYAPDSAFRIFTWTIPIDLDKYRSFGAIQMRTTNGSLKLFPLFDYKQYASNLYDSVRTCKQWFGCMYYQILLFTYEHQKYYTLLGFDQDNVLANRKVIEVLWFNKKDIPMFGGNFFIYRQDMFKPPQPAFRFAIEYKKDANVTLHWDKNLNMIVFDQLTNEQANIGPIPQNFIPSGVYEGFRWIDNRWYWIPNVFNFVPSADDKKIPLPKPLLSK